MSLWDNEDAEPWDKNVPPDLIPAIKFLHDSFRMAHATFGILVTMPLCYSQLHKGAHKSGFEDINEYVKALVQLKSRIGPAATQRFHDLITQGTLPAIFKGFFDFYLEGVKVEAILTFNELLGIGRANEARLNRPHIEGAESQTQHLIRSERHSITIWVQDVCDVHTYDPHEDQEEQIFWRKWQAPSLLIMKPSRFRPYDSTKVWERNDPETSSNWLETFADRYVLVVEIAVKDAAGNAALEWAKQPKSAQQSSTEYDLQQGPPPSPPVGRPQPAAATRPTSSDALLLKYRSEVKRAVLIQLTQSPGATDLEICRALDGDGAVDLPKTWKSAPGDRLFVDAYRDPSRRHGIEIAISKVRADLRKRGLLPGK